MQDVNIFLKSGQTVHVVCEYFKIKSNGFGQIVGLEWGKVEGEETLLDVTLDQIAAITYKNP